MKTLKEGGPPVVMICANKRPEGAPKPSCGHHGAEDLRGWLKDQLKAEGLWGKKVRVLTVSCLDVCPSAGVVCSLDGGKTLELADAETERDELLRRCRALAEG
jgi:hypothetical protein